MQKYLCVQILSYECSRMHGSSGDIKQSSILTVLLPLPESAPQYPLPYTPAFQLVIILFPLSLQAENTNSSWKVDRHREATFWFREHVHRLYIYTYMHTHIHTCVFI